MLITFNVGYGSDVKIGVLANRGEERCRQMWSPTAEYLSKKLPGYTFNIVPLSFEGISSAVQNEEVDFLLCNPSIYVDFESAYGVSSIATLKNEFPTLSPLFGGVIFTRSNNTQIYNLKDLIGKKFIAVDPTSFGGWYAALRELKHGGIDPSKDFASLEFSGNHEVAIYAVLEGKADAGTANTDVFADLLEKGRINQKDFRIIIPEWIELNKEEFPYPLSTRLYPNWPFSKLRKTPDDLSTKVAIALLSMNSQDKAALAAGSRGWSYPLNYQSIHELKKELRLGIYEDFGKVTITDIFRRHKIEIFFVFLIFLISFTASIILAYLYRQTSLVKMKLDRELAQRIQTEQKLFESQELFRTAVYTSPTGIIITDMQGNMTYCSEKTLDLFGFKDFEEIKTKKVLDFITPDDREKAANDFQNITDKMSAYTVEYSAVKNDGAVFFCEISFNVIRDSRRNPIGIFYIIRDITKRQRALEALSHSEERFRKIFEKGPLGMDIVNLNYQFEKVNSRLCEILGYAEQELTALSFFDITHPEDIEKDMSAIKQLLRGERLYYKTEKRYINKKKEIIWADLTVTVVRDKDGKPLYFLSMVEDITERKRAEDALEKLRRQNELILKSADEGILGLDLDGRHTFVNTSAARMLGYEAEELIGKKSHAIWHHTKADGSAYPEDECPIYATFKDSKVHHNIRDEVFWRKDGTSFSVAYSSTPIIDKGNMIGAVVDFRDITERKMIEDQIKSSLYEKEILLREIHHRVKNNMQIISSLMRLSSESIQDDSILNIFSESRGRIKSMSLIHEKLYQSRDLTRIDFSEYIESLIHELYSAYGIDPNRIKLRLSMESVPLSIDAAIPCGLIMNELITNVLKHAFPEKTEGDVFISLADKGREGIELIVSDNGIGIPTSIDLSTTKTLGLYIVNILAKDQLEGNITLDRANGTSFRIMFKEKGEKLK